MCFVMVRDWGWPPFEDGREYILFTLIDVAFWPIALCFWIRSVVVAVVEAYDAYRRGRDG